jgi:hypothetical protein
MRRLAVALIVLGLLALLSYAAYQVGRVFAPVRLHAEIEAILVRETKHPVELGDVQLVWGLPIELEGRALKLFEGALTIEHARARVDSLSLLTGHPRLSRLELEGVEMGLSKAADGPWLPRLGPPGTPAPPGESLLEPLRTVDGIARRLLAKPFIADALQVRDGHFSVTRTRPDGTSRKVRFVDIEGLLQHSRLQGDASMELRGRWVDGETTLGTLDWKGARERDGHVALKLDAKGLALKALAPVFHGALPELALRGRLAAVAELDSREPSDERILVTLDARDLRARARKDGEWVEVPRLDGRFRLGLAPKQITVSKGTFDLGDWMLRFDGNVARPVVDTAETRATLGIDDLQLSPDALDALVRWLPESRRERVAELVAHVRDGRLVHGEISATAPLERWRGIGDEGGLDAMLPVFAVSAQVEALRLGLEGGSELSDVSGLLEWRDGNLDVRRAHALLDGQPLPALDLRFRDLATVLERARPDTMEYGSAHALPGISPLFAVLRPPSDAPRSPPPRIALDLDWFHHRALILPVKRMQAEVVPGDDGFRVALRSALWAGVPIQGSVDVALRPERRLDVRLELQKDGLVPLEPLGDGGNGGDPAGRPWTSGWIDLGATPSGFVQRHTRARLRAVGATIHFEDVVCELEPAGQLTGKLDLDLSHDEYVPYALEGHLQEGNLGALIAQRGFKGEPMQGTLTLDGPLTGTLVPGRALLHDAGGNLSLAIRDGTIPKTVPPVLALALASDSLNPFSSRERIRYHRVDAALRFETGRVSTQALDVEGPDLRMFAAGEIDLREKPNPLRAEIALFLFRQLDWALVKIPILSQLLLGENQNLVAAYFQLGGTWQQPLAEAQPLRTLQDTAGGPLLEGIPGVVLQGMKAIGALWQTSPAPGVADGATTTAPAPSAPSEPPPPAGS